MTLRDELQPIFWRVFDPDSSTQGNVQAALDAAMPIIDRWLAAHDAEVRAAALAEQGETEWETEHAVRWVETDGQPVTDIGAEAGDIAALVIDQKGYAEAVERRVTPWMPVEGEAG